MIQLQPVQPTDEERFRAIVETYWQELMPHADMMQDAERRNRYFQERFPLENADRWVRWGMVEDEFVGFVAVALNLAKNQVMVEDFYVLPSERRKGYGGAMVKALYQQLDEVGVELVELSVRRDNPQALAFWEAQGFRIALYQLRQYRDPEMRVSFVGALSSDFIAEDSV